jgi:lipid A 4'-phosphatase
MAAVGLRRCHSFGSIISLSRIVVGGHFLSDVVFAGVFTFLIVWVLYAIIYRWKPTRLDDNKIEKALERFSAYIGIIYRLISRRTYSWPTRPPSSDAAAGDFLIE